MGQGRPWGPAHPASHSLLHCLVTLILQQAMLGASTEAFWKQAEGASQAACLEDMEANETLQKVLRPVGVREKGHPGRLSP